MAGTQAPNPVSTKQARIAELAKRKPNESLRTLAHHMDIEWMTEAYRRTRKDGAPGVDGITAEEYEQQLESNLRSLLDRAKSGERYRAPPVRRVHIPKGDGRSTRPIGIPTFEDKVLQRAVAMLLEPIYEQEFLPCSYGFRPGRSAHQMLQSMWNGLMAMGGGWVLELDIKSYFDSVDHAKLREMLRKRVSDGVVLRLLGKWLNAGVLEEGRVKHPEAGTPQGGVISPVLSNVYLHEVLDVWFAAEVKPRMHGQSFMLRYADDAVLVFAKEHDARKVMTVIGKRFAKYGLTLHPEKTRLVKFERPSYTARGGGDSESFDLLGFTHHWGRSLKGNWVVRRKTSKQRTSRALRVLRDWLREHRHDPVKEQHRVLSAKLRGLYGYYGIPDNSRALGKLHDCARTWWQYWLNRRSSGRRLTWERFARITAALPLPRPRTMQTTLPRSANP